MLRKIITAFMVASIAFTGAVALATPSYAIDPLNDICVNDPGNTICKSRTQKLFGPGSIWTNIVNTMIFVVGAVSVIMVVVGGLKYTLSGGDSSGIKSAKDTILYAIIGLVIASFAYSIVNFVLSML